MRGWIKVTTLLIGWFNILANLSIAIIPLLTQVGKLPLSTSACCVMDLRHNLHGEQTGYFVQNCFIPLAAEISKHQSLNISPHSLQIRHRPKCYQVVTGLCKIFKLFLKIVKIK